MGGESLVMLAGEGESTRILYHFLKRNFAVKAVILERPVPRTALLRRRLGKLGIRAVAGQALFQAFVQPLLRISARARTGEIIRRYGMDPSPIPEGDLLRVASVNSAEARERLRALGPDLVVINGTRILSRETIGCVPARFLNMHAGITPLYRGVHGGYWALVQGRKDACGVTVHLVDTGIDTGGILAQGLIDPAPGDNFSTYPLLQLGVGLELLGKVLSPLLGGAAADVKPAPAGTSRLWSHPTLCQYLGYRLRAGVK